MNDDDDDDEYDDDDDDDDKLNSQLTMSMPHYWRRPPYLKWDVGTPVMLEMTSRALMTIKRSVVSLLACSTV